MMHRNKSVSQHQFAMVPRADIPRAAWNMQKGHKTTFDAGYLIPVLCEEILPGDSFNVKMTAFARLATPLFPLMDNLHLDSFFFFVPNRLVWDNFQKFMGEQENPGDSTSFLIPQIESAPGGFPVNSIFDYFGLPTVGQYGAGNVCSVNALPLRAYNLIYNEWFRDQNLIDSTDLAVFRDDGPDAVGDYALARRGKRHDYFTSCLPWPQKGDSVKIPLGDRAIVYTSDTDLVGGARTPASWTLASGAAPGDFMAGFSSSRMAPIGAASPAGPHNSVYPANLYADLSEATAATINQLRQSFQIQKLLERDARGGTRYTEIVRSHFGVISPDARLQRPEYLGGGSSPVVLNPVAQTSATEIDGSTSPLGNLAAVGTMLAHGHGFRHSFTEHGYVIGLVCVRADLNYQQGIRRMWSRRSRYDFYFPAFAMLGEQAVLSKEIYADGTADDEDVFGYQERWAEYRYSPSQITGLFRSTSTGTLDAWHLAQRFSSRPVLNKTFIQEQPPVDRVLAVGSSANGAQFIFDSVFDMRVARPMPLYSVPGLIDHF